MKKTRVITFDIAKGIAILLVVIGHYIPANAPVWYEGFVKFFYHFHMPLFFVVAGYFFSKSTRPVLYGKFVWAKFERLMIPYFLLSILVIGIKWLAQMWVSVDHPIELNALYRMFYLPEGGFFLWFVYVLFIIFCIVPWFKPGNRLVYLSIVAVILPFIPQVTEVCCLRQLCNHLIFFVVGMWVARCDAVEQWIYRGTPLWTVITFSLLLMPPLSFGVITAVNIVWGVAGSFMILGMSKYLSRVKYSQGLNQLGLYSMTIYLFHTLFMGGGKVILSHIFWGEGIISFILSSLFIIGVGVICPILLYKWVWAKNGFTCRVFK